MKYSLRILNKNMFNGVNRYINCSHTLIPQMTPTGKGFKTGLTDEEARKYEKALYQELGTLNPNSPAWENEYNLRITRQVTTLDSDIPEDAVRIAWLKQHSLVANGLKESQMDSRYEYVLYAVEEEEKAQNKKFKRKRQAYQLFGNMSAEDMRDYLFVMGKNPAGMSTDAVENEIQLEIEANADKFISTQEDKIYKQRILIAKALAQGVLKQKGGSLFYEEEFLGSNTDAIVETLMKPTNANILAAIMDQVK